MDFSLKNQRISLEEGKSVTVGVHTVHLHHPLHWHSFFEVEIILSGEGKYVINDIEYDIAEKNVFLLTSTDFHYLKLNGTAKIINISFDETMMNDSDMTALIFSKIARAYSFDKEEYQRVVNIAEALEHECNIDGDCREALLSYVIRCLLRKNAEVSVDNASQGSLDGIRRAIIYMELHFRESISLDDVASEAGYAPAYFSRLFKRVTGSTYVEMLTKYRLAYAATLLDNGFSVSDSCYLSGFGSLTAFRDSFTKKHGISPSEYKKRKY